ncbi:hypothetical protein HDU86_002825 [Geranomyces michiganensis]|nr:hypothetical protein HDU86_002825 [Geranomyces michiganensis]
MSVFTTTTPAAAVDADTQRRVRSRLLAKTSPNFVNGASLLDELAFVSWFHRSQTNRAVHVGSVALGFSLASSAFAGLPFRPLWKSAAGRPGPSALVLAIPTAYTAYFTYLYPETLPASATYMGLIGAGAVGMYSAATRLAPRLHPALWAVGTCTAAAAAFTMQGKGHVILEAKQPAFRLFEAAVTAPFATVLWASDYLGSSEAAAILHQAETLADDPVWVKEFVTRNVPAATAAAAL